MHNIFLDNWNIENQTCFKNKNHYFRKNEKPRAISIGQLNTSPCLHFQPINVIFYNGSYSLKGKGKLILT